MREKIVLSSFVAVLVVAACGCKTKVDPGAFEGGAAATPSVDTTPSATATDTDAAAADASSDTLAPLQTGGAAHPTGGGGGGGGGSHAVVKPPADPPECVQARSVCGGGMSARPTKACQDAKFACFNKGGHL